MRAAAAASLALLLSLASTAAAQPPLIDLARLEGPFAINGTVTVAVNVHGEQPGQTVQRLWTFTPLCAAGPCATVGLVRTRAAGTDSLVLQQQSPGTYVGTGQFYAPLRCARHFWRRGEIVPFSISVTITAATEANGVVLASAIDAGYTNLARINRTPCVAVPGHDAAHYAGALV